MDAIEAIRGTINHSHGWFEGTTGDLTQEQADYLPSGTAHPIGEIVAHILQSEDMIINGMIQGQPSVWESGGWEQKLGIPNVARHTQDMARGFKGDLAALQPYKEASSPARRPASTASAPRTSSARCRRVRAR